MWWRTDILSVCWNETVSPLRLNVWTIWLTQCIHISWILDQQREGAYCICQQGKSNQLWKQKSTQYFLTSTCWEGPHNLPCLYVCPSVCPSVRPYVCPSVCLSVCLYVCLSVMQFLSNISFSSQTFLIVNFLSDFTIRHVVKSLILSYLILLILHYNCHHSCSQIKTQLGLNMISGQITPLEKLFKQSFIISFAVDDTR